MIAIKYASFAIIAILFNLLFQYLSFSVYVGFGSLYVAIFIGTLTGLIIKFTLDKKYIFYDITKSSKCNIKRFVLYTYTGAFITALFWVTEIIFDAIFENEISKYIGAIIGLSIGYITKYFLDKKYVFGKYI